MFVLKLISTQDSPASESIVFKVFKRLSWIHCRTAELTLDLSHEYFWLLIFQSSNCAYIRARTVMYQKYQLL
ncbi:unnamed protein product, partial [Nesidiocoris tenuis]